jgi:hypothetical protein
MYTFVLLQDFSTFKETNLDLQLKTDIDFVPTDNNLLIDPYLDEIEPEPADVLNPKHHHSDPVENIEITEGLFTSLMIKQPIKTLSYTLKRESQTGNPLISFHILELPVILN